MEAEGEREADLHVLIYLPGNPLFTQFCWSDVKSRRIGEQENKPEEQMWTQNKSVQNWTKRMEEQKERETERKRERRVREREINKKTVKDRERDRHRERERERDRESERQRE